VFVRGYVPKLLETRTNFKNFWQGFLLKNLAKFRARNFSPEILAKKFSFGMWEPVKLGAANAASSGSLKILLRRPPWQEIVYSF